MSLEAVSCYGDKTPQYVWSTSHPSILNISSDRNSSKIEIVATGQSTEGVSITVEDVSNHLQKTIDVMIESFDNADVHLIAHYPFNNNGNDQSGYQNHATVYNATLAEDRLGQSNSAYYFSGGDYIDCGNNELFNLTAPFSLSLWIYASSGQTGGNYYNIIAKESIYSNGYGIELYGKRRMIQFWVVNKDKSLKVDWVYGSDSAVAKKWIHLVGVHTGSKLQFYVNNKLVDQENIDFMAEPSDFPLRIGRSGRPLYYDTYFHGKIDDVYIFNRVLTPAEISFLFKNKYIVKVKSKCEQNLQKYKLNVNYPNPFNPKTVITYEIPQNEHVVLRITDILGRKIKNLVNGHKKAGYHSVNFNAENLAGGIYFYTLTTGSGMTMTKKMLLLK
ncbi:T9SS type A sorting domain-containing protein [candidate division KSB1 bacterium]|nr:T9SS type A sorting domain-containing protein [candidate division KSB1 bacterium]